SRAHSQRVLASPGLRRGAMAAYEVRRPAENESFGLLLSCHDAASIIAISYTQCKAFTAPRRYRGPPRGPRNAKAKRPIHHRGTENTEVTQRRGNGVVECWSDEPCLFCPRSFVLGPWP